MLALRIKSNPMCGVIFFKAVLITVRPYLDQQTVPNLRERWDQSEDLPLVE